MGVQSLANVEGHGSAVDAHTRVITQAGPDGVVALTGELVGAGMLQAADAGAARLFEAWRRSGPAALLEVPGTFACALRDRGSLYLYCDPSGLSRLYYRRMPTGVVVASLRLADSCRPAPAASPVGGGTLHEYLRFLDIAGPETLVHGVRSVEPGQLLRVSGAAVVDVAVAPVKAPPRFVAIDFDAAVDGLDERLRRSVARRLDGARQAAAFLSGGVDSALLCAIAARQQPTLTALTVGFDGARFDESPQAERIAAHLGLPHRVLRFDRQQCLAAFERLMLSMDQPMADPATLVTVLAFDHCREHFDVVLDGTGADEAVGAMPPRHVRLAVGWASHLPWGIRRTLARAMTPLPGLGGYRPVLDFEHPADTMIRWKGFTRPEIAALCGEPVSFERTRFYRAFASFPRHAHLERYSALLNAMPCDRLTQAVHVSGAQVRFPFCDDEVDRFLRQLPTEWRHLPGQAKRILRELLARYAPRQLWDLPKHSFDFPLHEFLAADAHALVHRHVLDGRWLRHGLLREDLVRRYALQYIAGDRQLVFRVWALVVLGAWLDHHDHLI